VVTDGIKINNIGKGLIANIPITAPVGSIVNYEPVHPIKATMNERRGKPLQQFYVQIADDEGTALPQNEDWSVILTFRQRILLSDKPVPILDLY